VLHDGPERRPPRTGPTGQGCGGRCRRRARAPVPPPRAPGADADLRVGREPGQLFLIEGVPQHQHLGRSTCSCSRAAVAIDPSSPTLTPRQEQHHGGGSGSGSVSVLGQGVDELADGGRPGQALGCRVQAARQRRSLTRLSEQGGGPVHPDGRRPAEPETLRVVERLDASLATSTWAPAPSAARWTRSRAVRQLGHPSKYSTVTATLMTPSSLRDRTREEPTGYESGLRSRAADGGGRLSSRAAAFLSGRIVPLVATSTRRLCGVE